MNLALWFTAATALTFALTALILKFLIPKLKSHKMGQKILDIGPRWHKNKEGTPTMGGISFTAAATAVFLPCLLLLYRTDAVANLSLPLITLGYGLLNGAIGFIDDYTKFIKKQNEGLTAPEKYLLQLIAAGIYLAAMTFSGNLETSLYLPFFGGSVELGFGYYIIAAILLTGTVNSVNLTDGIDGLASSVTMVVAAFFALLGFLAGMADAALLSGCLLGGCLGFLVYNFHPARVFMGDTGSLFLGGMVVGLAFMLRNPLIILVCGFVYILETASVILQVLFFRLTNGKRLFKMSPIHHHFEKCGWSEVKIVSVFTLLTLLFSVAAFFGSGYFPLG